MKDGYSQKKELTPVPATSSDDVSYVPEITKHGKEGHSSKLDSIEGGKGESTSSLRNFDVKADRCSHGTPHAVSDSQGKARIKEVKRLKTESAREEEQNKNEDSRISVTSNITNKTSASELRNTLIGKKEVDRLNMDVTAKALKMTRWRQEA